MEVKSKKFVAERDYYDVLGLDGSSTIDEIDKAYEKISNRIALDHPIVEERIKAAEKMLLVNTAYETLSSSVKRSQYDIAHKSRKRQDNSKIDDIFAEGLKYYRNHQTDEAIQCFKKAVQLHPHKAVYRVHLALAYHEKKWYSQAETELKLALKIEPNNEFAQEVTAKIMFKIPDKKILIITQKFYKQATILAVGFIIIIGAFITDLPQRFTKMVTKSVTELKDDMANSPEKDKKTYKNAEISQDVANEIKSTKQNNPPSKDKNIPKMADDYIPKGQWYDYTKQEAVKKTYYPEQGIMVVNYKDGSVLTYKPAELTGWKMDDKTKQAIMITKDNEFIPSPSTLPILQPNGDPATIGAPNYPENLFPEYSQSSSASPPPAEAVKTEGQKLPDTNVGTQNTQNGNNTPGTVPNDKGPNTQGKPPIVGRPVN